MSTSSPLGLGLACTFCNAVLPFPQPNGAPPIFKTISDVQPPLGLGTDPKTGAVLPSTVSGRVLLAQALVRRLSTSRGGLPDTKIPTTTGNYGLDLLDYVYADMTPEDVGMVAALVDAQCRQDERVISSNTTAALVGSLLVISINIVAGVGPFKLTLAIDVLVQDLSVLATPG